MPQHRQVQAPKIDISENGSQMSYRPLGRANRLIRPSGIRFWQREGRATAILASNGHPKFSTLQTHCIFSKFQKCSRIIQEHSRTFLDLPRPSREVIFDIIFSTCLQNALFCFLETSKMSPDHTGLFLYLPGPS